MRPSLWRTSAVLLVGTASSRLLTIAFLPIYTALLTKDQYGRYDLIQNTASFLAPILFMQVWDALYRHYFDEERRPALMASAQAVFFVGTIASVLVGLVMLPIFGPLLALAASAYGATLSAVYQATCLARVRFRNTLVAGSGMVGAVISACASLVLLLLGLHEASLLLGTALGNLVQPVMITLRLRNWHEWSFRGARWPVARSLLTYSLPLCLSSSAYWALSGLTRFVVLTFCGLTANGILGIADRFSVVILLGASVVNMALAERLFSGPQREASEHPREAGLVLGVTLGFSAIGIFVVDAIFPYLTSPQYGDGARLAPLMLLAAAFNAAATFLGSYLLRELATIRVLASTLGAALVNGAGLFVLVPQLGVLGGAISLVISFGVMMVARLGLLGWLKEWRCFRTAAALGLLATGMAICCHVSVGWPAKALVLAADCGVLAWSMKSFLRQLITAWRRPRDLIG